MFNMKKTLVHASVYQGGTTLREGGAKRERREDEFFKFSERGAKIQVLVPTQTTGHEETI